jgi:subtilisin family serine protease
MRRWWSYLVSVALVASACTTGASGEDTTAVPVDLELGLEVADELLAGTWQTAILSITPTSPLEGATELHIEVEADGLRPETVDRLRLDGQAAATDDGAGFRLPVSLQPPLDLDAATVTVQVSVRVCDGPGCEPTAVEPVVLTHDVRVVVPDARSIPPSLNAPLPEDVVTGVHGVNVRGELLVLLDPQLPASDRASTIREVAGELEAVLLGADEVAGVYQLRTSASDPAALSQLAEELSGRWAGRLVAVTPNLGAHPAEAARVPDVQRDLRWDPPGESENWHWAMLDMPAAWAVTVGSDDVEIAIVDSWFDLRHPDLANVVLHDTAPNTRVLPQLRLWTGEEGREAQTHGNHVSALACAPDGVGGVVGAMWDCRLVLYSLHEHPLNVDEQVAASQPQHTVWTSEFLAALTLAGMRGVDAVNVSLAYEPDCEEDDPSVLDARLDALEPVRTAVRAIVDRSPDTLWVFGAGNSCRSWDSPIAGLAAERENVVAVAATNSDGSLAPYSVFGDHVTLAAPGGFLLDEMGTAVQRGVRSAVRCSGVGGRRCDRWDHIGGTSMAAPMVTGVAGLLRSVTPDLPAGQVRACLEASAERGGRSVTVPTEATHQYHLEDASARTTGPLRVTPTDLAGSFVIDPVGALECATDPDRYLARDPDQWWSNPVHDDDAVTVEIPDGWRYPQHGHFSRNWITLEFAPDWEPHYRVHGMPLPGVDLPSARDNHRALSLLNAWTLEPTDGPTPPVRGAREVVRVRASDPLGWYEHRGFAISYGSGRQYVLLASVGAEDRELMPSWEVLTGVVATLDLGDLDAVDWDLEQVDIAGDPYVPSGDR